MEDNQKKLIIFGFIGIFLVVTTILNVVFPEKPIEEINPVEAVKGMFPDDDRPNPLEAFGELGAVDWSQEFGNALSEESGSLMITEVKSDCSFVLHIPENMDDGETYEASDLAKLAGMSVVKGKETECKNYMESLLLNRSLKVERFGDKPNENGVWNVEVYLMGDYTLSAHMLEEGLMEKDADYDLVRTVEEKEPARPTLSADADINLYNEENRQHIVKNEGYGSNYVDEVGDDGSMTITMHTNKANDDFAETSTVRLYGIDTENITDMEEFVKELKVLVWNEYVCVRIEDKVVEDDGKVIYASLYLADGTDVAKELSKFVSVGEESKDAENKDAEDGEEADKSDETEDKPNVQDIEDQDIQAK